jgi:superfamily I DNA/RNA helicase
MRLPTWDELVPEQLDIMDIPLDRSVFVVGPPGSGKTVLAVHRANAVNGEFGHCVVLTYSRMLKRLVTLLGGLGAETMHSYIATDFRRRTQSFPPRAGGEYEYAWQEMLKTLDGHDRSGYTHNHLLVDEGQDLPGAFFEYARRHVAGTMTVFADEEQSIEVGTSLEEIKQRGGLPDPIILTMNHRNTSHVAALAAHFHDGRLPVANVRRSGDGFPKPRLIIYPTPREIIDRIGRWFQLRGGSVGIVVSRNDMGQAVRDELRRQLPGGTRIDMYTSKDKNESEINVLNPGLTIVNVKSVKGQEFDSVFILELGTFLPCSTPQERRVMYMLCSRARDYLFLAASQGLSAAAVAQLPAELVER